tara:strand:+ start:1017 stop:1253 length:237 start_codon:yes stop_codon:yes gene_type:complete
MHGHRKVKGRRVPKLHRQWLAWSKATYGGYWYMVAKLVQKKRVKSNDKEAVLDVCREVEARHSARLAKFNRTRSQDNE